ncbi:MAG: heavy metal translocating P-type ATPase, partial [Anaerotignum sp.]|nr:heavy metal translocating P-type ATPase [Anaerotignum sp.]
MEETGEVSINLMKQEMTLELKEGVSEEEMQKTVEKTVHKFEPDVEVLFKQKAHAGHARKVARVQKKEESCCGDSCCCGHEEGPLGGHVHGNDTCGDDCCAEEHHHEDCGCHEHDGCGCGHDHEHGDEEAFGKSFFLRFGAGLVLFLGAVFLKESAASLPLFLAAYLVFGYDVLLRAVKNIARGQVFDENFLMSVSTIGALAIGEMAEAVFVMLFYQVGEAFQDYAVARSRKSITALLDIRPDFARLVAGGETKEVAPELVCVGDSILVKAGERIPLDGMVEEGHAMLDTAALTGESLPRNAEKGDHVLSGCINMDGNLRIRVEKPFGESTVMKILEMVENAAGKKSRTEKFITRFARV